MRSTTRRSWLTWAAALAALAAATPAGATTAVALSNRAMAEGAEVIATGRCVDVRSVWEGRTLVTLATIALDDVLKGDVAGTVTVALPGGVDANRRFPVAMTYPGAPQIAVDEAVFLFLDRGNGASAALTVMGFSQGKFSIVDDGRGERAVSRNLSGLTLRSAGVDRPAVVTRSPLDAFKDEIRGYLQKP